MADTRSDSPPQLKPIYNPDKPFRSPAWTDVWPLALRFSVAAQKHAINHPHVKADRGYTWALAGGLAFYLITTMIRIPFGLAASPDLLILCIPFTTVIGTIIKVILYGGLGMLVARAFGGRGTYAQHIYLFAALIAPVTIILAIAQGIAILTGIVAIEIVGQFVLGAYQTILISYALKAINDITWTGALVATLPSVLGIFAWGIVVNLVA